MTWSEFTQALRDVVDTGRITGGDTVQATMRGLDMVTGSTVDAGGLVLTDNGRKWYQRAVVDRENERILEAYGAALDRVFDLDKPRGLR